MPDPAPAPGAATAPRASSDPTGERLQFLEKFGFGAGGLASNLLFQTGSTSPTAP